ncbi:hypothetical protein [Jiella marina]|uniref:hypothetical protein n=1 Tax=Jiella sp. LLJ827 TaxID=2917712 RepID=UPI002101B294|nr:hypothetical protein [Jiella sp. LLJ827]MCQ0989550.1 hypothetical protein [Jiella sp. LLJ827]
MAFAVICLTPAASGIATAQEQRGPTRLMPVQVPAGFAAGPLQPNVSQIMIRQLRQASESAAGNCLGDMRQITVAAPSRKSAAEFQSNADLRLSEIVALGRRRAPNDLLLLYSLTGIGKADIYQGQPQIAAAFRYRLIDVQADTVLLQASHFSERLQGGRCDPAKL